MKTPHQPYDLIGDIHGYAGELKTLLHQLGYRLGATHYAHPQNRKVIFLGDYIDRGPQIRETLQIVKGMVDHGAAHAIMGNHEFNALAYATLDGKGGWCRPHTEEKVHQHQATLTQLAEPHPEEWQGWLDWFSTLPLFLELKGLRAVHASWNSQSADAFRNVRKLDARLIWDLSRTKGELRDHREALLNGPEIRMPEGYVFSDKSGFKRNTIRTRWWQAFPHSAPTYRGLVFPDSETVPDEAVPAWSLSRHQPYAESERPVFVAHYWLPPGQTPAPQQANVACLDYSVAKGGGLTAYRWDGETKLVAAKFISTLKRSEASTKSST